MKRSPIHLAVIGATGAVGQEVLRLIESRQLPLASLRCFASPASHGKVISCGHRLVPLEILHDDCFKGLDIVIFCAGSRLSRQYVPLAVQAGALVIDNSSAFRMDPHVPLIIPEINPHALVSHRGIIASPNCSTTIMLMPLAPLHRQFKIQRIVVATYQAASGAGWAAMQELLLETRAHLDGQSFERKVIPFPYAFNLFPHPSALSDCGYVEEELKMRYETRKILEDDTIGVHATCVRVPVLRAHSESINATFHKPVTVETAIAILRQATGVTFSEDRAMNRFPMPSDVSGQDSVFCGRLREDPSHPHTLDLWVVGDQLLKGAALNAIQIAELLIDKKESFSIHCEPCH